MASSRATALRRKVKELQDERLHLRVQEEDDFRRVHAKYHHPSGPYDELTIRWRALSDEICAESPDLLAELDAEQDFAKKTYGLVFLGGEKHLIWKSVKDLLPASWINPGSEIPNFDTRDLPMPGSIEWSYLLARSHAITKEFKNRLKDATGVCDWLMEHEAARPFVDAVDPAKANGYYDLVKLPMDITTLRKGSYDKLEDFLRETRLIFDNCRLYYPAGSINVKLANRLEADLLRELAKSPEFNDAMKAYPNLNQAPPPAELASASALVLIPRPQPPSASPLPPAASSHPSKLRPPKHTASPRTPPLTRTRKPPSAHKTITTAQPGPVIYACTKCQYRAHVEKSLKKHIARCTGKLCKYICEDCGWGFHDTVRMRNHRQNECQGRDDTRLERQEMATQGQILVPQGQFTHAASQRASGGDKVRSSDERDPKTQPAERMVRETGSSTTVSPVVSTILPRSSTKRPARQDTEAEDSEGTASLLSVDCLRDDMRRKGGASEATSQPQKDNMPDPSSPSKKPEQPSHKGQQFASDPAAGKARPEGYSTSLSTARSLSNPTSGNGKQEEDDGEKSDFGLSLAQQAFGLRKRSRNPYAKAGQPPRKRPRVETGSSGPDNGQKSRSSSLSSARSLSNPWSLDDSEDEEGEENEEQDEGSDWELAAAQVSVSLRSRSASGRLKRAPSPAAATGQMPESSVREQPRGGGPRRPKLVIRQKASKSSSRGVGARQQ